MSIKKECCSFICRHAGWYYPSTDPGRTSFSSFTDIIFHIFLFYPFLAFFSVVTKIDFPFFFFCKHLSCCTFFLCICKSPTKPRLKQNEKKKRKKSCLVYLKSAYFLYLPSVFDWIYSSFIKFDPQSMCKVPLKKKKLGFKRKLNVEWGLAKDHLIMTSFYWFYWRLRFVKRFCRLWCLKGIVDVPLHVHIFKNGINNWTLFVLKFSFGVVCCVDETREVWF